MSTWLNGVPNARNSREAEGETAAAAPPEASRRPVISSTWLQGLRNPRPRGLDAASIARMERLVIEREDRSRSSAHIDMGSGIEEETGESSGRWERVYQRWWEGRPDNRTETESRERTEGNGEGQRHATGLNGGSAIETGAERHGFDGHTQDEPHEGMSGGRASVSGTGYVVRNGTRCCPECGRPWDPKDKGKGVAPDTRGSYHRQCQQSGSWGTPHESEDSERLSNNHGGNGERGTPEWLRTRSGYGREGWDRLTRPQRARRGTWANGGEGSSTTHHVEHSYSTPKVTVCGTCGRDWQMEYDTRYFRRHERLDNLRDHP